MWKKKLSKYIRRKNVRFDGKCPACEKRRRLKGKPYCLTCWRDYMRKYMKARRSK